MAEIVQARVWLKVDTYNNWMANDLILGKGEMALVVGNGGIPLNMRWGDGTKAFRDLPNAIAYDQGQFVPVVGNALPSVTGVGYTILGGGTYTQSVGGNVVVPDGKLGVLVSEGGTWSLQSEVELPVVDVSDDIIIGGNKAVSQNGVSKIAFDKVNFNVIGETQSESSSIFSYESSSFSGWGCLVGNYTNFDSIRIKLKAWNIDYIPTVLRVIIRTGVGTGTVLADKTINISLTHNSPKNIDVKFDNVVNNSTDANLWVEYRTNGRVGIFKANSSTNNSVLYATSSDVTKGMTGSSTTPNDKLWIQFMNSEVDIDFSDKAKELIKDLSKDVNFADIILPNKIYCLEGIESNIYFENIILSNLSLDSLDIDISGVKGRHDLNRWTYTPISSDAGTTSLTITVSDLNGSILSTLAVDVITVSKSTVLGTNINANFWGDSNLSGGEPLKIINTESPNYGVSIDFQGTLGASGLKNEGRPGWRIYDYTVSDKSGDENPLWIDGGLDYSKYILNNSIQMPSGSFVIIQLGTNDMFNASNDVAMNTAINAAIVNMNKLITAFKAVTGIRIGVCTSLTCAISQDAFGDDYKNAQRRVRFLKNIKSFAKKIISEYSNRESEGIYIVPTQQSIDPVNGFPFSNINANSRSSEQVRTYTNAIHPNLSGYNQLGDEFFKFLLNNR